MQNARRILSAAVAVVAGIGGTFAQTAPATGNPFAERGASKCSAVSGTSTETIIPASQAPNDPFGRVIGLFQGDFGGATVAALSAILTTPPTFSSPTGPVSLMTVRHVFTTGPGDTVITLGQAAFIPGPATLPGQSNGVASVCPFAPCVVENTQNLTIIGGTGKYAGATGTLKSLGQGNLDLTNGAGEFIFAVKGQICVPKS